MVNGDLKNNWGLIFFADGSYYHFKYDDDGLKLRSYLEGGLTYNENGAECDYEYIASQCDLSAAEIERDYPCANNVIFEDNDIIYCEVGA